jgi:hypothetical protein
VSQKWFFLLMIVKLIWMGTPLMVEAKGFDLFTETILGTMERDTPKGNKRRIIPVYEYLGVNYENAQLKDLSLHFYGWGRTDLADSAFFEDDPDGDLIYGYIAYIPSDKPLQCRLGRQYIFAGVTHENVDGLSVSHDFGDYFSVALFGGLPADYRELDGSSGDLTYGGRFAHHFLPHYQIGISYQTIEDNGHLMENKGGVDFNFYVSDCFSLNALSSYNFESFKWREHRYDLQILMGDLQVEPFFQYFQYKDYFGEGEKVDNVFNFLQNNDEELTSYGADLIYNPIAELQVGTRGRQYEYHLRDESASYIASLLVINTPTGSQIGAEFGRMDGQSPENNYDLLRSYLFWQNPLQIGIFEFISIDFHLIAYDEPVFEKDTSTRFSFGVGRKFFVNHLETKLSVEYNSDPYVEDDISGLVTIQLNY